MTPSADILAQPYRLVSMFDVQLRYSRSMQFWLQFFLVELQWSVLTKFKVDMFRGRIPGLKWYTLY